MLSIKGREPFIRMQLWLNDPQNIEKLHTLKNERRENGKRKRLGGSGFDSSSDRSSPADPTDFYSSSADSPGGSAAKKQRILFSEEQKEALKIAFTLDPYPNTTVMDFLSQELGLECRSISNWFHNHRMRLKQQLPHGMDSLPFANREGGQSTFDTVKFKILCHQRMMEMQSSSAAATVQGSEETPPPPPSAILAGGMSSFLRQLGLPALGAGLGLTGAEGLDLTFKTNNRGSSENENDRDSIAESNNSADNNEDPSSNSNAVTAAAEQAAKAALAAAVIAAAGGGSRSRRKPVAPQWLRPETKWLQKPEDETGGERINDDDEEDNKSGGDNLTINGVCVMDKDKDGGVEDDRAAMNDSDAAEDDEINKNASSSLVETGADCKEGEMCA